MSTTAPARFVYEVCMESKFPIRIYACAMMYLHAFNEYTSRDEESQEEQRVSSFDSAKLVLAVTCLLLSLKANENYLNSTDSSIRGRTTSLIEGASRVIFQYAHEQQNVSREEITQLRRTLRDAVSVTELTLLRVIGNSIEFGLEEELTDDLETVDWFATPECLNRKKRKQEYAPLQVYCTVLLSPLSAQMAWPMN